MSLPSPTVSPGIAVRAHLAAFALVALVALIVEFGYPVVISLALFATLGGLAMLVGLTAIDLLAQPKPKSAARKRPAGRLAVRSA
jgi:hypothetical protein